MNDLNNENSNIDTENAAETEKHTEPTQMRRRTTPRKKTFLQRNKYRIRQVCGVLVLVLVITGTTVLLTKCGSSIDDASSSTENSIAEQSRTETSPSETSTTTSGTTSKSESDTTTTPETTTEQTTTEPTTTEEITTTPEPTTTTTPEPTTTTTTTQKPTQTTTQSTTTAELPVGPAKIEVKNGLTYVNGILIANKTYSVPASYNPGIDPNAQAAFNKMQQAAAMEGISLWICSGFRSYSYQQQLYNSYVYQSGQAAADRFSARAGHSEHQTGLAMDINYASSYFDNTPEAKWLAAHCTDYGFIIRYKPGKESSTGYMAESWHIRYLGDVNLCKKIEASGLSLEEYLGITSVYS